MTCDKIYLYRENIDEDNQIFVVLCVFDSVVGKCRTKRVFNGGTVVGGCEKCRCATSAGIG